MNRPSLNSSLSLKRTIGFMRSPFAFLFWTMLGLAVSAPAVAAYTVTPVTWNIIGLDSNTPTTGPNRFPVGARVCGGTPGASDTATLTWDAGGTDTGVYIYLRAGSANPVTFTFGTDGCADAFFEVEVNKTALAYDQTRRYHITSGGVSTPTPRELYVEHLVSQARSSISDMKLNGVSVAAGGSMNLVVGNTYTIELDGGTATQGYSQFEDFINFSNTVFQILSISTSYTANTSPYVSNPNPKVYADACLWDNDPNSPTYRSCIGGNYNTGGTVATVYTVKIASGGGTTQTLNALYHDFSGSSFHYNSDYSTGTRFANIIDPSLVTIAKSFSPGTTNAGGVATLTFTLTNPNAGAISGLNFIDVFPTSPGAMTLSSTTTTNTCGGTLTDNSGGALAVGSVGIKLAGGTIPANSSCMVQIVVTVPTTGIYSNTSDHLFVDALDTGKFATASLTVNSTPPPPPPSSTCSVPVQLAAWNFDNLTAAANSTPAFSAKAADVATATATLTGGTGWSSSIVAANAQSAANAWHSQGYVTAATGTSASATYIDFVLDTSNYGGVVISYSADTTNGNWGGTNHLYSWSKADAGAFGATPLVDTTPMPSAFTTYTAAATATGTGTTTFRINASGSKSNPAYSFLYLDDISFTGCTRPLPNLLTVTKSFAANPVAVNGTSTLTFTVTNSNATSTASLTGIGFTDTFPLQALQGTVAVTNGNPTVTGTGTAFLTQLAASSIVSIGGVSYTVLSIASNTSLTLTANYAGATAGSLTMSAGLTYVSTTSNSCAGTLQDDGGLALAAGDPGIKLSAVTLAPATSCTVVIVAKANAAGAFQNVSGFISSTETGSNTSSTGVAKATLTAILPPSISKLFAPNPILANGVSTLTFTLSNPNQNDALSGIAFSDTFPIAPGAMRVAAIPNATTSGCGAPTFAPVAGAASISFTAGSIAAGGTCTVKVDITAPTVGSYANTSGAVSATTAGTGNTASDTLTVTGAHPQISLLKQVSDSAIGPWKSYQAITVGANVYYQFTVENPGDVDLTSVSISDPAFGGAVPGCNWVTLLKYDSKTCTAGPVAAVSGVNINTATASGTYSATTYTDVSSAVYVSVDLTLTKSATQTYFTAAGNVLDYSYEVQNTGSATLQGPLTITDDKATVTCPAVSTATLTASLPAIVLGDGDNWFDPGEQLTCTASYTVLAADVTAKLVTNTASATIGGFNSTAKSVTIPLAPDLSVNKTNDAGASVPVGNSFNWTIIATNSVAAGTATFANAAKLLTDELPTSGATYALGTIRTSGVSGTGTINCALVTNTVTCTASGGNVIIPWGLQGTISVTNGSAAVTGTGTAFTTQLAANSIISISGVTYTVATITNDTTLTLTANYSGATASGITVPGSFSVPVTVTTTATGSLVNPKGGGICAIDPDAVVVEINEANNSCTDTVIVRALPSITLLKTVAAYSDPVNLLVDPKFIPGAIAQYNVIASNSGGPADNNSTFIIDAIPANTRLHVNDIGGAGSGPLLFTQGATSSTLVYTFTALGNMADDLDFSNDGGTSWTATPSFDLTTGCDTSVPAITHIRANPKGTFTGSAAAPNPSFQISFRVCVQ